MNAVLLATEVVDVNGAWVRYDYDSNNQLSRIHASDGREITVSRRPDGLIGSITAHGRTWSYGYTSHGGNLHLSTVTLPDGRSWSLNFSGFGYGANAAFDCSARDSIVSLTHPDGISGSFTFRETRHLKGDIINDSPSPSCLNPANPRDKPFYDHMSLISRTLSGQGYPSATWTYAYSGHVDGATPPALKWGQVIAPDGVRTREFFHVRGNLEGLMQRREIYAGSSLLSTETLSYAVEPALGVTMVINQTQAKHANPRPVTQRAVTQGGETYTTQFAYNATQSAAAYSFGRPTQVTRSSTVQAGSRTTQTSYVNRLNHWIVALPATVTENGVLTRSNTYDSLGRLTREDRFGALHARYGYHTATGQQGALAWVRDALNRQVSLGSWRRGVPRSATRPDGVVLSRAVNDFGQLTSQTDARGTMFTYSYDQAGRLTLVNRPGGFADTTLSYTGLGAGLTQTITHGALRTIVSYDAMLRPTREERRAISSGGGSVFTRFGYDALNRTVFQSFPSASAGAPDGAVTSYDGLGRVTRTEETVAPFAATVTAYLSDNRVRVTDPAGAATTTWRSGYGGPDDGDTVRIDHPLGLSTRMSYDALGNLLTARQFGSHSGFSVDETQTWAYDSRRRLCRHATPQSGHTLYAYDAANQMTGVARGAAAGTGCAALPSALRVTTSYDLLGRVDTVNFPDSSPDIDLTHDANGNLTAANRGITSWAYAYDALDRLTNEVLTVDGRIYAGALSYTSDSRLNTRTTPGGRSVSFAPDGHGRATRARIGGVNHAGSAVYHPSGQLSAASYSNGLTYSASFNARQTMTSMRVNAGSTSRMRYSYGRDALGRVTALTDHVRPGQNRSFSYDGLGRLTSASGPWGSGSFSYDLLNNIRSKTLGPRTVELQYNSAGRMSRYRDTAAGNVWRNQSHDARGNTTNDGLHGFVYDRSERPVSISGGASGSFVYDAHGRRVKQTLNGETIYTAYGLDGTLLFRDNAATGEETDYIRMGAHTVGRFDEAGVFTWTHSDHLGSASAATNAAGVAAWRESYTPFGEILDDFAANRDQPGFTGHIRDAATGLTYAQARYYNPVTARFLAPDPVGFADMGPGYFNRYAYTKNDPVNLVDPDGEQSRTPRHRGRIVFSSPSVQTRYEAAAARNEQLHQQLGGGPSIRPTPPSIVLPSHARRLEMANQTLARAVNARNGAAPDLGLSIDSITLRPGPFARESIPARPGRPSPSQQGQINRIGNTFGCHTCGTSNSGRASGNWTADHQPPSNLRPAGSEQRFFPQCARLKTQSAY